ncbi:hypothetical protein QLX08_010677 [Tetragonisca angustula]|uniref:Uncharacterized protein n=1 Tax=Tetragonisca angustula TaxID=166442 RepID=A0AAW0ZDA9_9HYME
MRVPGCGVPPPPDSRRFDSNNSQTTDNNNTRCNDCNNNNNNNVNEIFDSPRSVESNNNNNNNVRHHASNWPIARGNQREGIASGGCLEHHDSTGCLTAETARPTPLPPQRSNGRPSFVAVFFARRKFAAKTRAGPAKGSWSPRAAPSFSAVVRSRCSRSWSATEV